jgi:hypothetical protein
MAAAMGEESALSGFTFTEYIQTAYAVANC